MKTTLILAFLFLIKISGAQEDINVFAQNVGGKAEFEHIFQTQLIYPEDLLKSKTSEDVTIYFTVAVDGKVSGAFFKQTYNKAFEEEARRLLRFYQFEPATKNGEKISSQGWLTFKFNADAYKKICKNRGFVTPVYPKEQPDTSFVIYNRADASPNYYMGEEALGEFIIKQLDYPPIAIRQNIQGTVVLGFIVEPNGRVSNISVVKGVNAGCSEEAVRVIRLTKWKPATKDGKLVRYKMTYPIVFNLNNVNQDNSMGQQR